jgi:hypothetical protein
MKPGIIIKWPRARAASVSSVCVRTRCVCGPHITGSGCALLPSIQFRQIISEVCFFLEIDCMASVCALGFPHTHRLGKDAQQLPTVGD